MTESTRWRPYVFVSLFVLIAITLAAGWTRVWVITAVPVGFLFGFFLQKGDLCGASAFSEVLISRDWQKTFGLWVAIVVSMVGFAALADLELVRLAPKQMLWLNYLVGGALFGVGMVLAGGCISGCLFKAGAGNLNSMAALAGIPLGVGMVEYGPLNSLHRAMMTHVVKADGGGAVTLGSLTGLPYWALALAFAGTTIAWVLVRRTRRPQPAARTPKRWTLQRFLTRSWRPWQAGVAIGLLAVPAYLSSAASGRNYPLGVTHGVLHAYQVLTDANVVHVWRPAPPAIPASAGAPPVVPGAAAAVPAADNLAAVNTNPVSSRPPRPINWWLVALVASMVPGAWMAARLSGMARLVRRDPVDTVTAFFGGALAGIGAGFANGCVVGNILSGWALMSVGL